jgi:transcription termination factor Rho
MPVLSRAALQASPLADLHAIASELGIDGFRRLRKADLVAAILERGGAGDAEAELVEEVVDEAAREPAARPRGRSRGRRGPQAAADDAETAAEPHVAPTAEEPEEAPAEPVAEGVVELLGNGSGFVRVSPPEPSEQDVYISAAQVRRCELVSGDRVSGPVRRPRRSERYPSLIRIDTINGAPADEVAEGTPFDELPCALPSERFELGDDDPTLEAIDALAPIGRGSRVVIAGPARAGKTEALRRLAGALARAEGLELTLVLAGVRPEEVGEYSGGPVAPAAVSTLADGADGAGPALERAAETSKRLAARGGHAVLLVDTLDGVGPAAARRALAAARNLVDGGSLTVIATATAPFGGETTVVTLDPARTAAGAPPGLDLARSGALRPELLVGEAGVREIAAAHAG